MIYKFWISFLQLQNASVVLLNNHIVHQIVVNTFHIINTMIYVVIF